PRRGPGADAEDAGDVGRADAATAPVEPVVAVGHAAPLMLASTSCVTTVPTQPHHHLWQQTRNLRSRPDQPFVSISPAGSSSPPQRGQVTANAKPFMSHPPGTAGRGFGVGYGVGGAFAGA